jgi:hypothetical protein
MGGEVMVNKLLLPEILAGALVCSAGSAVAQVGSPAQQRIPETGFVRANKFRV